ncbi:MAG: 50S ribosomal protein L20 [Deltaproteobacteria bacterium]|nr:50S ribosomal protein L20 [Deltaproteobacteria bacterium]
MPRATNAPSRNRRRKKVLKRARGFNGMQKTSYRVAVHKVARALAYAYDGRKQKKRDYRALWNVRINAAARQCGTTYSKLIHNLASKNIELDRKILADIALHDPDGFAKVVEAAGN